VALLSNAFAILAFDAYRRLARGREEILEHQVLDVMTRRPNPYQTPFEFKRLLMGHLVFRGNAFARIWTGREGPELWPLHPDRVAGPELLENGRLRYQYQRPDTGAKETLMGGTEIMHLRGLSSDGLRGLALADLARESIGLALATEQHGGKLFAHGARFAGVLKTPGVLGTDDAKDALSKSFRSKGTTQVPVLEAGMEFQAIGMSAEDAQFLETRKFQVSDIARWFGVPPHMIGDVERTTSWGTGIEHQSIQFVTYGLLPWVKLWEEALRATLIPEPDLYCRFNVASLLRADAATRFNIYQLAINNGIFSPNECRELEEMNPREGGDEYLTPLNMRQSTTPELVVEPEEPEDDEDEGEDEDAAARLARALATARAADLVEEERAALVAGAKQHAADTAAWRGFVAGYYGRRAVAVSRALCCSPSQAKGYCEERRDLVLGGGVEALVASGAGAVERLVGIALNGGGHVS
jgi:HK97 family phage portal protein